MKHQGRKPIESVSIALPGDEAERSRITAHGSQSSTPNDLPVEYRRSLLSRMIERSGVGNKLAGNDQTFADRDEPTCRQSPRTDLLPITPLATDTQTVFIDTQVSPGSFPPSRSIRRFMRMCLSDHAGLDVLDRPLRYWQNLWHSRGLLHGLMAASIPNLVAGKRFIEQPQNLALVELANACDWPLIGLDLVLESERQLLNNAVISDPSGRRLSHFEVKRQAHWYLGLKRRTGTHVYQCVRDGVDTPLRTWISVWRDIGVLRSMIDAYEGLILPVVLGRFTDDNAFAAYWYKPLTTSTEYMVGLSYAKSLPGEKHRPPERMYITEQGAYRRAGRLFVGQDDSYYHCDIDDDGSMLPSDSVGLSHGVRHRSSKLSPWCPLSLVVAEIHQHAGADECLVDIHTMGMRVTKVEALEAANVIPVTGVLVDSIPPGTNESIAVTKHLDLVRETDLCGVDWMSSLLELPQENSMAGIYPQTWIVYPRRGTAKLVRTIQIQEAVLSHWMFSAGERSGIMRTRHRPKLRHQFKAGEGSSEFADFTARVQTLARAQQSNSSIATSAQSFLSNAGSAYRIPLVSMVLEEVRYLSCLSTGKKLDQQGSDIIVKLTADRRTLHIMRLVIRTWFRAGMDAQDIHGAIRSMLLDLVSGMSSDLVLRYQMVRITDQRYCMRPIPVWSQQRTSVLISEQLKMFGGAVIIDPSLRQALIANPKVLRIFARQTGLSYRTLYRQTLDSLKQLSELAPRYLSLIESLDPLSTHQAFRSPELCLRNAMDLQAYVERQQAKQHTPPKEANHEQ